MAVLGRIVCHTGRSTPVTEDVFAKELHGLDHAWPRGLVVVEEIAAHKQNVRLDFYPTCVNSARAHRPKRFKRQKSKRAGCTPAYVALPSSTLCEIALQIAQAHFAWHGVRQQGKCMDRRKEGKGVLASYFLAFVKTSSTARKLSSARGGYFESSAKPRWLSVEMNIRKVFASGGGGCICRALSF